MTARKLNALELFRAGLSGRMAPEVFEAMLDSIVIRPGQPAVFTVPPEALACLETEEPARGER